MCLAIQGQALLRDNESATSVCFGVKRGEYEGVAVESRGKGGEFVKRYKGFATVENEFSQKRVVSGEFCFA